MDGVCTRVSLFMLLVLALAGANNTAQASDAAVGIDLEKLQSTLEQGLKARQAGDFAFITRVVRLVARGRIPSEMVETTFYWAVRQHRKYPFPYFAQGLRERARRIGIEI